MNCYFERYSEEQSTFYQLVKTYAFLFLNHACLTRTYYYLLCLYMLFML